MMNHHGYPTIIYNENIHSKENVMRKIESICAFFESIDTKKVMLILKNKELSLLTMLATLECEICFIPIDPDMPPKRIITIITEHSDAIVITDLEETQFITENMEDADCVETEIFENKVRIFIRISKDEPVDEQPAYIIYTSGSSGVPKGVMIGREELENLIDNLQELYTPYQRFISLSKPSFDFFIGETVVPALLGKEIYIVPLVDIVNPRKVVKHIRESLADVVQIVPSRLRQLHSLDKDLKYLRQIKLICLGGEDLSISLLKTLQNRTNAAIYNLYGPTEGTVWSTIADLTKSKVVHIGKPFNNTVVKLIDRDGNATNEGELVITGRNVARGYYNNTEATNIQFTLDEEGKRSYLTGDICRWLDDGNLQFLGRKDRQIKSLGYRIELDEIEKCIESEVEVENAAVFVSDDNRRIIAWYVGEKLSIKELKQYMEERLPKYMMPYEIKKVYLIPINTNGKKDYRKMKMLYKNNSFSKEELDWIVNLCKKKISDQIQDFDEKWTDLCQIDSLSYIELIVEVETKFKFQFPDEVLSVQQINSLQQILDLIEKLRLFQKKDS